MNSLRTRGLLTLITCLCFSIAQSSAAESIDVSQVYSSPIGEYLSYFQEADQQLSVEMAQQQFKQSSSDSDSQILSFGMGAQPVWLNFSVENKQDRPISRDVVVDNAWLDKVDIYIFTNDKLVSSLQAGDSVIAPPSTVAQRTQSIRHSFGSGKSDVYIRVATTDPISIPLYFYSAEQSYKRDIFAAYSYGFLYGTIVALLIYNLILFLGLRKRSYLYFTLYLSTFILANFAYTGHGTLILWPESPIWQQWSVQVFMMLFNIAGLVFACEFLNVKKLFYKLYRAIIISNWAFSLSLLLAILFDSTLYASVVAFTYIFFFPFLMVGLGLITYVAGSASSKYFLTASVFGAIGSCVTLLAVLGILPFTQVTFRAVEAGMFCDVVLLALALTGSYRLNQERRTVAENMARIDPLTRLNNRRSLYELSDSLWLKNKSNQRSSLILFDVDHFKSINDQYGHAFGDEVLRKIADILMSNSRTNEVYCRWGGEEFLIFLPQTSLEHSLLIAERFREMIASFCFSPVEDEALTVTASFGVSFLSKEDNNKHIPSLDEFIEAADIQLYRAKANGRNCVYSELSL